MTLVPCIIFLVDSTDLDYMKIAMFKKSCLKFFTFISFFQLHFYYYEKVNQIKYLFSTKCANSFSAPSPFSKWLSPCQHHQQNARSQEVNTRTWCVRALMSVAIKLNFSHTTNSSFFYPPLFPDPSVPNSTINLQLPPKFCCAMASSVE